MEKIIELECKYCGKKFYRYKSRCTSKGLYCSLDCAYKDRYKEINIDNDIYNKYYKKHLGMIKILASSYANYYDEMLQVGRITLWKVLGCKDNIKNKFSTYLYKALKNDMILYYNRNIKNKFYQIYENQMCEDSETLYNLVTPPENIDIKIDSLQKLDLIINEYPLMCDSCKMVIEKELLQKDFDFLKNKYKKSTREITVNLYNGKKILRNNALNKWGWQVA